MVIGGVNNEITSMRHRTTKKKTKEDNPKLSAGGSAQQAASGIYIAVHLFM